MSTDTPVPAAPAAARQRRGLRDPRHRRGALALPGDQHRSPVRPVRRLRQLPHRADHRLQRRQPGPRLRQQPDHRRPHRDAHLRHRCSRRVRLRQVELPRPRDALPRHSAAAGRPGGCDHGAGVLDHREPRPVQLAHRRCPARGRAHPAVRCAAAAQLRRRDPERAHRGCPDGRRRTCPDLPARLPAALPAGPDQPGRALRGLVRAGLPLPVDAPQRRRPDHRGAGRADHQGSLRPHAAAELAVLRRADAAGRARHRHRRRGAQVHHAGHHRRGVKE